MLFFVVFSYVKADEAEHYNDCLTILSEMKEFLGTANISLEETCRNNAIANNIWDESGNPVIYLSKYGCNYLNYKSTSIEECLPSGSLSGISAIKIMADADTSHDLVVDVIDISKSRGVKEVLLETRQK